MTEYVLNDWVGWPDGKIVGCSVLGQYAMTKSQMFLHPA